MGGVAGVQLAQWVLGQELYTLVSQQGKIKGYIQKSCINLTLSGNDLL